MRLRIGFMTLALLVTSLLPVQAELIITATGGTVTAGGSTLDVLVYISSNASDSVGQFTAVFNIVPDASNAIPPVASLAFLSPTSSVTDPTLNNPSYIYAGANSFQLSLGNTFGTASDPGSIGYNTQFAGSDIYNGNDPSGGQPLGSSTYLLADLVVTFSAPVPTNALSGDVFNIYLSGSSSFADGSGNPLTLLSPGVDGPAIAQVTVLTTVPEPSSISLVLLGVSMGVVIKLREKRSIR